MGSWRRPLGRAHAGRRVVARLGGVVAEHATAAATPEAATAGCDDRRRRSPRPRSATNLRERIESTILLDLTLEVRIRPGLVVVDRLSAVIEFENPKDDPAVEVDDRLVTLESDRDSLSVRSGPGRAAAATPARPPPRTPCRSVEADGVDDPVDLVVELGVRCGLIAVHDERRAVDLDDPDLDRARLGVRIHGSIAEQPEGRPVAGQILGRVRTTSLPGRPPTVTSVGPTAAVPAIVVKASASSADDPTGAYVRAHGSVLTALMGPLNHIHAKLSGRPRSEGYLRGRSSSSTTSGRTRRPASGCTRTAAL